LAYCQFDTAASRLDFGSPATSSNHTTEEPNMKARITAVPAVVVLALLSLTACRPTAGLRSESSGADSGQSAAPSSDGRTVTAASPAGATGGAGSVTAALTSPVEVSGTTATPVTCTTGRAYRAEVSSVVIHGDQLTFDVMVGGYRGPGSYSAVVGITLHQPDGVVTTVAGVARVPADLSAAGGSFTVKAVGTQGRTVAGSLSWHCGS
jgi:hypothetical protein